METDDTKDPAAPAADTEHPDDGTHTPPHGDQLLEGDPEGESPSADES
jgi:hypothetical protein